MTLGDRVKQVALAMSMAAVLSSSAVFVRLRYEAAAALFGGNSISHASVPTSFGEGPVNDGCPRHDHTNKKDLTLRFFREMPWSRFDGWIEIDAESAGEPSVLYRGPYDTTITIRGVCYGTGAADEVELAVTLVTKHHLYHFDPSRKISLGSTSEIEVDLYVDAAEVPRAGMEPIR